MSETKWQKDLAQNTNKDISRIPMSCNVSDVLSEPTFKPKYNVPGSYNSLILHPVPDWLPPCSTSKGSGNRRHCHKRVEASCPITSLSQHVSTFYHLVALLNSNCTNFLHYTLQFNRKSCMLVLLRPVILLFLQ